MDYDTWLEAPYVAQGEAQEEFEAMEEYIDDNYEKVTDEVYRDSDGDLFRISEDGRFDGEEWRDYKHDLNDIEDIKQVVEELESENTSLLATISKLKGKLKEDKK